MVDAKKLKEVSASFAATAATVGAFPAPVVDGSPVSLKASGEGVLYATLIAPDGSVQVSVVTDNTPAPAAPIAVFVEGIFRSALPTYADGDASVFHMDSRGRLLVQLSGPGGNTNVIGEDAAAAPANPDGIFTLGKYEATLPTYTDGDAAVVHTDVNGRVIVNDQLPASTATLSNVSASVTSVTLLAANADRRQAIIYNDSSANLYIKFGTTASTTSFTALLGSGGYYELPANPIYTGRIDGIWDAATGDARVTELTA